MAGRLAVLHHPRSFFPLDLVEAVGESAQLMWAIVDGQPAERAERRLLERLGPVAEISSHDLPSAIAALAKLGVDGVITFVDDHLVLAADLAAALGLPFHSPVLARTLADKLSQREALSGAGVPGPRFWPLPADATQLAGLASAIDYPAVLKPAYGMGSRGIERLDGPADLLARARPDVKQFVEELMPDDPNSDPRFASYLSVESVVNGGDVAHVALTGRFALADPFRETGNFIPAALGGSAARAVLALADATIAGLGITVGVLHLEVKLTSDGPRVIELNGRLGGRPPFVLRTVSPINLFAVACQLALGLDPHVPSLVECDGVGYWRMIQPPRGARSMCRIEGLDEVAGRPYVDTVALNRRPGDPVDWQEGTDSRVVTVRGRAPDHAALADVIATIDDTIRADYTF